MFPSLLVNFFTSFRLKLFFGSIIGFTDYCLCGDFESAKIIAILLSIDFITGVFKGIKNRNFNSFHLARTGTKIVLYFCLLIMAHQAEKLFLFPGWTDDLIEGYIGFVEVLSILENAAVLGFTPARKIARIFNKYVEEDNRKKRRLATRKER